MEKIEVVSRAYLLQGLAALGNRSEFGKQTASGIQPRGLLEGNLRRFGLVIFATVLASAACAGEADNGKRLASMQCVPCHAVLPTQPKELAQAPPFDVIARKFALTPQVLAFAILDPHPRMNVTLTRREAEDIAAYINTLAK